VPIILQSGKLKFLGTSGPVIGLYGDCLTFTLTGVESLRYFYIAKVCLYAIIKSVFGVGEYVIYPGGYRLTLIKLYCLQVHVAVMFSALLESENDILIIRCLQHNTHKHRNLNP